MESKVLSKLRIAYSTQKCTSRLRGIAFLLTFDEWLKEWIDSGHLHERGCKKGNYVMARFGDTGPYAVGNVKIITCGENVSEAHPDTIPEWHKEAIRTANTGMKLTVEQRAKVANAKRGKRQTPEHIANAKEAARKAFQRRREIKMMYLCLPV